jgi:hypothetical protein
MWCPTIRYVMLKPWLGHQKNLTWGPSAISYQVLMFSLRIINDKEARQTRCTPALSANASRNSGANLPGNCTRTYGIFNRSAGYALFVLIITATKLLCMKMKMVIDRFRHDSSTIVAPISYIFNLCILLMTPWLTNKFVSRESVETARVATGAGFMESLCRRRRRGWRAPMRDSIILEGILAAGSKLRITLRWTVVVSKEKMREVSRMNVIPLSLHPYTMLMSCISKTAGHVATMESTR